MFNGLLQMRKRRCNSPFFVRKAADQLMELFS